jgi:YegS/Rv2252/BmrU family lipid kinase
MKKVRLIYNPKSGNKTFPNYLDNFIKKFQQAGYETNIFRSNKKGDISNSLKYINNTYKLIIIAGGDGSVNSIVNEMMKKNTNIPLGIIPAGTVNDFANYLNMPNDINACIDVLLERNFRKVDIGQANNNYFINVCIGGLLSNVSHNTDLYIKNRLGKVAYYINGLKELPNIKPLHLRVSTSYQTFEEKFYMFIILNSKRAGGFTNLAQKATINDGLFDFVGVKASQFYKIPNLLYDFFQGDHLASEHFIYLQDNYFKIEHCADINNPHYSDLDGEKGPKLPLEINIHPKALTLLSN